MDQLRDLVYTLMNIMGDTLKQKILMRFHPVLRDSKPRVCRLGSSLAGFFVRRGSHDAAVYLFAANFRHEQMFLLRDCSALKHCFLQMRDFICRIAVRNVGVVAL